MRSIAIADDMNAALIRSAFTPIIYEGKDCSVALLDAERGNVLGQSPGLPLFLGNLEICVQAHRRTAMAGIISQDGDVFYMNDSYMTGTHLNDSTDDHAHIPGRRARSGSPHRAPTGSTSAPRIPARPVDSVRDLPGRHALGADTKLYENGQGARRTSLMSCAATAGSATALIGDLNAQIAAGKTGEQRLQDALFERFGRNRIVVLARHETPSFARPRHGSARRIRRYPRMAGTRAEGWLDNDGLGQRAHTRQGGGNRSNRTMP